MPRRLARQLQTSRPSASGCRRRLQTPLAVSGARTSPRLLLLVQHDCGGLRLLLPSCLCSCPASRAQAEQLQEVVQQLQDLQQQTELTAQCVPTSQAKWALPLEHAKPQCKAV